MKDKLLREIEIKLSLQFPEEQREKIMQTVISSLNDYDVTQRVTDLTVRHEDINERILKRYVACIRIDGMKDSTIRQYARTLKWWTTLSSGGNLCRIRGRHKRRRGSSGTAQELERDK